MRNKKIKIIFIMLVLAAAAGIVAAFVFRRPKTNGEKAVEVNPAIDNIQTIISVTGTVYPKNRLEVKPPVNGRIESILVKEGERVKAGQPLALMSSTERAALLDAARGQGDESLKYWQDVYKAIQLFSPIDGEVIVATTQPGQTVTTSDAVIVLSDQLIVRAQVDETDIGKIKVGQSARLSLDAYPDDKINAKVEHIYYESETVNNVTVYIVDLIPESVPAFFRSGMNASIDFITEDKKDILTVPVGVIIKENEGDFVLVKQANGSSPLKREVKLGLSDDSKVEIISGLSSSDTVVTMEKGYSLPKESDTGTNPFMPNMGRGAQSKKTK
jgi:membrane fusion protein, macrolide-specific efflux system